MMYLHQLKNHIAKTKSLMIARRIQMSRYPFLLYVQSASPYQEKQEQVTAILVNVKYIAAKNQAHQKIKHSSWHCTSKNIIKVLLESGSDGDQMFHQKGTHMHFPYLTRQVPLLWRTLNGSFLTKGRSKVVLRFF